MKKCKFFLCTIGLLPLLLACKGALSVPGKVCADLMVSTADEIAMGNNFRKQILADPQHYPLYTKNPALVAYIDSIGQSVVRHQSDRPDTGGFKYTFTVIALDTVVNAFSVPGGPVFVYTGLIRAAKNEAELAGVIAHEVAHVTNRHGVIALCNSGMLDFLTQLVLGDSSIIGKALEQMSLLQFSQLNEYQADTCSVKYLIATGYNPYGMKTFLGTLKALYGDVPTVFEPFSDHPPTSNRITLVGQAIANHAPDPQDSTSLLFMDRFIQHKSSM